MLRLFIILFLLIGGCAVGPNYHRPVTPVPSHWQSAHTHKITTQNYQVQKNWWQGFHDPILDELIDHAITNNFDVKIAIARVKEARAETMGAHAALLPQLNVEQDMLRGNLGFITQNRTLNLYQSYFDATWEIDFFGGNYRKYQAKQALVQAHIANQHDVLITLLAEVTRNYIELRNQQTQLSLSQQNLFSAKEIFQLTQSLQQAGIVNDLDSAQAHAAYQNFAAQTSPIQAEIIATKHRLSTLLGENPGSLNQLLDPKHAIPRFNEHVLLATPLAVIMQRPDVRIAERELAAATHLQGAAIAAMFPKINLLGFFGWQDTNFILPSTNIWAIANSISMPLINFGRIHSQIKIANAQQEQAFYRYQKTVVNALAEVETNLSAYVYEQKHLHTLQAAVISQQTTLDLAKQRYKNGLSNYIVVLNSQRDLYAAQSEAMKAKAQVSIKLVALYKSLGGC